MHPFRIERCLIGPDVRLSTGRRDRSLTNTGHMFFFSQPPPQNLIEPQTTKDPIRNCSVCIDRLSSSNFPSSFQHEDVVLISVSERITDYGRMKRPRQLRYKVQPQPPTEVHCLFWVTKMLEHFAPIPDQEF